MRSYLVAFVGLVASSAAAFGSQSAPPTGADNATIVVTGSRLSDSDRALRECIARNCPAREEMLATLAHAENQFIAGEYGAARETLRRGIGRHGASARENPHGVSALYRADARIAVHMGEMRDYRRSTGGTMRALKAGLGADHPQVLIGRFDVAQMYLSTGDINSATREYGLIRAQALRLGHRNLAAQAELRHAWLTHLNINRSEGLARLRALAGDPDPAVRSVRLGAMVMLARVGPDRGGLALSEELVAELSQGGRHRALLVDPGMQPETTGILGNAHRNTTSVILPGSHPNSLRSNIFGAPVRQSANSAPETHRETWVDVGFHIRGDGRVEGAELLRTNGDTAWTGPVLSAIRGRIYTPSSTGENDYRVERYSFTSPKQRATHTRIDRHSGEWRIEQIDLTSG